MFCMLYGNKRSSYFSSQATFYHFSVIDRLLDSAGVRHCVRGSTVAKQYKTSRAWTDIRSLKVVVINRLPDYTE